MGLACLLLSILGWLNLRSPQEQQAQIPPKSEMIGAAEVVAAAPTIMQSATSREVHVTQPSHVDQLRLERRLWASGAQKLKAISLQQSHAPDSREFIDLAMELEQVCAGPISNSVDPYYFTKDERKIAHVKLLMQFCKGYVVPYDRDDSRRTRSSAGIVGKQLDELIKAPDLLLQRAEKVLASEQDVRALGLAMEAVEKTRLGANWLLRLGFSKQEAELADMKTLSVIVPPLLICSRLGGCDGMSPNSVLNCYLSPGCQLGTPLEETIRMDATVRTYEIAQRIVERIRARERLQ